MFIIENRAFVEEMLQACPVSAPTLLLIKKKACAFFSGSWKEKTFKPYNFEALGVAPDCGHLHPLMKVRTQFRQIFLEMG